METANLETNLWFKILKVILYLLLLTPLWFLSVFLFPFITTKVLYFRILVEIALVIYFLLAMKHPAIRPKWNWLALSVWIYMAVIVISSLFGVNVGKSFMGTVERGEGVVTMLHYALYFTMLTTVFRTGKDWYRYMMSAVGIIGFIGIYGLLQLTGFSLVITAQGSRISGTIGNPAFFAAVMLFGIFLSTYLLHHPRTKQNRDKKIYLLLVLAVCLIAAYASQTRGALVALIAAAVIYALFSALKSWRTRTRLVSGALLLLIVLGGIGVYIGRESRFVQSQGTLRRLATISPADITTQSRFDTWEASWRGWKDRFVLGYGYENYNIAFNKYFPARIFKDQGSQIWFDRAHNIIFDIGTTSGIVGLISYLSVFWFAIWGLFSLYKKSAAQKSGRALGWQPPAILALGLFAYFIQNFFVFDTHATYLVFFIILAYISFLFNANSEAFAQGESRVFKPNFFVVSVIGVLAAFGIYFINLEPALANLNTVNAIYAARTGKYGEVQKWFEKSLSYGTYMDEEIRQRLVDFASEAVASGQLSDEGKAEIYRFVVSELEKSIDSSPRDVKNHLYLMTVYNRAGSLDSSFPNQSLALGEKAIELSPTRPQIYFEIGQTYFNINEKASGIAQFEKALELNTEPKESHLNVAVAGILAGREDITEREVEFLAGRAEYGLTVNDYLVLARAYRQTGNLKKFIETHEFVAGIAEQTPETYARLAAAYGEVCDLDSAKTATDRAVALDSKFAAEAVTFLNQLASRCSK